MALQDVEPLKEVDRFMARKSISGIDNGHAGSDPCKKAGQFEGVASGRTVNRLGYDAIATQWDAARTSLFEAEKRFLSILLEPIQPGARILDLGCGTGRPMAEYLLKLGYALTGVDQSTQMLNLARARLPEGEWVECALERYAASGTFQAAVAWDSLFHVSREHHSAIFGRVRSVLQPGYRFMLTVGGSDQPPFKDTMFGHEFFYDSNTPEQTITLLQDAGFHILHSEFLSLPTSGRDKGRVAIMASAD